jgi:hypothetical protein
MIIQWIAGMNIVRIHEHYYTGSDAFLRAPVQVGAATACDRADGKRFVGVSVIADLPPIQNRPGFDEWQVFITPELRTYGLLFGCFFHYGHRSFTSG